MSELTVISSKNLLHHEKDKKLYTPHENLLSALFESKNRIMRCFSDIKGFFFIEHFAIKIFDAKNRFLVFSSTPSVEFNLIESGLWRYDRSFNPITDEGCIQIWRHSYQCNYQEALIKEKEIKHGFTFGFDIGGLFQDERVVYTFATRSIISNPQEYYQEKLDELMRMSKYAHQEISPLIAENRKPLKNTMMRLIVNNKKG